jgi:hypothetical protein
MVKGGCADQNIKIRNHLSSPPKMGTDFCKRFNDGKVQVEKLEVAEEGAKCLDVRFWIKLLYFYFCVLPAR